MNSNEWIPTPIGIDATRWITRTGCRTVLTVVHTIASAHRLLDVVDSVESDPRVQVVFTVAPDAFNHAVPQYLRDLGALVLPWQQAIREPFDLALAASYGGLPDVHAPLVLMAHGAGYAKRVQPRPAGGGMAALPPVYGLDAQRLTYNGRVLASAILLAHAGERHLLRRQCPQALPVAVVAGDPCLDRLVASLAWRTRYRRALDVADDQELVVVCSTWGRHGLFGTAPDLLPRIMEQLSGHRYRVGALLHPAVWSAHGPRQIRAWMRDCCAAGLILLDPTEDWRSLVIAADYLIGDHGSTTAYGAAIGRPVLQVPRSGPPVVVRGSAQELVSRRTARLDLGRSVPDQLHTARAVDRETVVAALTSRPGQADRVIRRIVYRLLGLAEPGRHRRPAPVPVPRLTETEVRS